MRVSALEGRIAAIENLVQVLQESGPAKQDVPSSAALLKSTVLVVFQTGLAASVSTILFRFLRDAGTLPKWIWLVSSCPLPFGIWLGFIRSNWKVRYYFVAGTFVGLLTFVGAWALVGTMPQPEEVPFVAGGFVIGPMIVYTSAAFFGRWASNRFRRLPLKPGVSRSIAETWTAAVTPQRTQSVNRVAAIISAIGPLLALIGSLVTAYFSYLGAIAKAKP